MKLWKLEKTGTTDYEEHDSLVIRSESDPMARQIGYDTTSEEWWLDASQSTCVEITTEGPEEVIIASYNA